MQNNPNISNFATIAVLMRKVNNIKDGRHCQKTLIIRGTIDEY